MRTQIEHANLSVKDVLKAARFLTTALPDFRIRHEHREADDHWIHVGTNEAYVSLNEGGRTGPGGGLNHLGFIVEDARAVRERLLAAGYKEGYQGPSHPHRERIYFLDDDGMEWEFVSYSTDDPAKRNTY